MAPRKPSKARSATALASLRRTDETADLIVCPMFPSVDVGAVVTVGEDAGGVDLGALVIAVEAEFVELLPAAAAAVLVWKVAPEVMLIPACMKMGQIHHVIFTTEKSELKKDSSHKMPSGKKPLLPRLKRIVWM